MLESVNYFRVVLMNTVGILDKGKKSGTYQTLSGFTLFELIISIAILSIIMVGLHQAMGTSISAYDRVKDKQELLAQGRFAMERMVMFVQETDHVAKPDDVDQEILEVSERMIDTCDNGTLGYDIDGDGLKDADNDSDGLVNEDGVDSPDPREFITFDLDKTDDSNWKLREQMPDYGTSALDDFKAREVVCEHIKLFECSRLSTNLVEIRLILDNGRSGVTLETRARARFIQ